MMGRGDKKAFGAHYRGRGGMFHVKHGSECGWSPYPARFASGFDNEGLRSGLNMSASAGVLLRCFTWNRLAGRVGGGVLLRSAVFGQAHVPRETFTAPGSCAALQGSRSFVLAAHESDVGICRLLVWSHE